MTEADRQRRAPVSWLITGAGRGLGRAFAEAALRRGDSVAATARDVSVAADLGADHGDRLLPLEVDVVDGAAVTRAVEAAHEAFGRLDVVVNNAGYGHVGAVEEITDEELHRQLDVNLLGALRVTRAALPFLRAQRSGHIIQISSVGGVVGFPGLGAYHASKWALEGLSESLAVELRPHGIRVTIVEPGAFDTDSDTISAIHSAQSPAYSHVHAARENPYAGERPSPPAAAASALLQIVDADEPPLRVLLGSAAFDLAQRMTARRIETWNSWEHISRLDA